MRDYKFVVGDLLKVCQGVDSFVMSPDGKKYYHNLRVEFRFCDGTDNLYVVATEDGKELVVTDEELELQEAAANAVIPEVPHDAPHEVPEEDTGDERYSLTRDEMLEFAQLMTFHLDDIPFSRETLRSEAWLLGYSFAKAHK